MWDKITVGKFQQLHDIIAGQSFENELDKRLHLLACLEDKEPQHYEDMPLPRFMEEVKKTHFLSVSDIPSVKAKRELVIDGAKYRVLYDFRDLTAGQFIDAINETKNKDEHVQKLHRILAAISVPEGKKYGDMPFDDVADAMLEVGILDAQAIALFFCDLWSRFLKDIPVYLAKRVRKAKKGDWKKLETALRNIGVGSNVPAM
ncbi:hypothetical protein [Chitinophaga cymbidii]|uniref:Uncharacterized protein n=1 Tax=Chitinophaga cymbidii TaxID=1096750 RepID=A0A512RIM6_9BACT|nr:hypothetical protein [Chitinophaga cymbidii]GEP95559.1 hypothetical protein CCY01nite_18190 [Chitinophaga cymbidii]